MENSVSPTVISRRRALTAAGGVLAGAALAAHAAPAFAAGSSDADAIVVGGGLAGLVATAELAAAGRKVLLLDQEPETNLGGQAFWSFGGLFLIDSDEQRLMGIKDSRELAWQDWLGAAGFDRGVGDPTGQDHWGRKWAEAYVDFAAGRSGPGSTGWVCGGSRSWAGPSAAADSRTATGTRCRASTSPGVRVPPWSSRSRSGYGPRSRTAR